MSTAEWILSIVATLTTTAIAAIIGRDRAIEHRLTVVETRQLATEQLNQERFDRLDEQLDQIEQKLDSLPSRRRSRES